MFRAGEMSRARCMWCDRGVAFYRDLSPCGYFRGTEGPLVAVGWLDPRHEFPTGDVAPAFVETVRGLTAHAWQPCLYRGLHRCELCPPEEAPAEHRNLFVPGDGVVFASPVLIVHYVEAHGYAPPSAFVAAVERCPAMNSAAYVEAVRQNGPPAIAHRPLTEWTDLARVDLELERFILLECSPAEQSRVALAVCRAVVEATKLTGPVVDAVSRALRPDGVVTPTLLAEARAFASDVGEAAARIEDPACELRHSHPGQVCASAFSRWSAASLLSELLSGDAVELCDALAGAHRVVGRDAWARLRPRERPQ